MKYPFLYAVAAASIGVGLGFAALHAQERITDFLNRPRFAVVNLNSVVKANEVRVIAQGKRGEEILTEAQSFAKRLKEELVLIENECNCVLLVSSAVISNAKLPDYTAHLIAKLGLSAEQQSNQLQQIEARLNSGAKR